jgi:hypothetical protein
LSEFVSKIEIDYYFQNLARKIFSTWGELFGRYFGKRIIFKIKNGDYRPISILPAWSKAMKIVMRDQMIVFDDNFSLLDCLQSGF